MEKMKSKIFLAGFLFISIAGLGQRIVDCDPVMIQKLDSVVNYVKEANADLYTPLDIFIYEFDGKEHYPVIEKLSLPSRTPVNRQNYFFDETGRKTYYILQYWNGDEYNDSGRTDSYYNDQGYLEREVFSGMSEGMMVPYQQHWYNYDVFNIVETYLRQMMYSEGVWTDFSYKNYIYNSWGQLIERNEQRISDDVIFWVELFTYDDRGRTATRIRQSLKYDPAARTYAMMNLNKQIYSYDIYGELSEYLVETWINDNWVLTGKSTYYRTLLYGRRVPVCYKGRTVMLPVQNVARILEQGGQLGACECLVILKSNADPGTADRKPEKLVSNKKALIYPNPASSEITVWLPESPGQCTDLKIFNSHGSLMLQRDISERSVTVNISHLAAGSYYMIFAGAEGSYTSTFIKK